MTSGEGPTQIAHKPAAAVDVDWFLPGESSLFFGHSELPNSGPQPEAPAKKVFPIFHKKIRGKQIRGDGIRSGQIRGKQRVQHGAGYV
jgi:hypothetical protein